MVSGLGLEPRMTGPKPVVIPFHHPEMKGFNTAKNRDVICADSNILHQILLVCKGKFHYRLICRLCFIHCVCKRLCKKQSACCLVFDRPIDVQLLLFQPKQKP